MAVPVAGGITAAGVALEAGLHRHGARPERIAGGCGGLEMGVLHTPGHTPGSSTFHLAGDRNILFTGDTLFMQSIGRTDLWGGSYSEIINSIQKKLMDFDDDTFVIAGHGQSTTIGHERRHNPFLR